MLDLGFFVIVVVVVVFWGAGLNSSQRDCLIISSAIDSEIGSTGRTQSSRRVQKTGY